ncbi:hypothetical protein SAMN06272722_1011128 [Paenibacillus sp. RU5A]|nr:hypothetical protein SAMN06272722_1011128 [Paenibacillus sp. RU5A]SOC58520.1 hypothetical protein SAMN05880581_10162 [Paenibacillus sp. RU26A]SOC67572.1 hypothetical protein SAMN05880586_10162 [Paenibacillus sp. RU5M]
MKENESFDAVSNELKQSLKTALTAAADALWDAFNRFGAAIREMQKIWLRVQESQELNEHDVKRIKPLKMPRIPASLPLKHQVINRKPVLAVARSRC